MCLKISDEVNETMSSFFKGNLLDEFALTKEKFETVVGLGTAKAEVLKMFSVSLSPESYGENATYGMLDAWCQANYNMPFGTVYDLIQSMTVKKFEDSMLELGLRGNPSAIAIMNEVIRKKESNGIVQVNFVNALPLETEEDKEND